MKPHLLDTTGSVIWLKVSSLGCKAFGIGNLAWLVLLFVLAPVRSTSAQDTIRTARSHPRRRNSSRKRWRRSSSSSKLAVQWPWCGWWHWQWQWQWQWQSKWQWQRQWQSHSQWVVVVVEVVVRPTSSESRRSPLRFLHGPDPCSVSLQGQL